MSNLSMVKKNNNLYNPFYNNWDNLFSLFTKNVIPYNSDLLESDMFEDDNQYIIKVPLPGFSKNQVEVTFDNSTHKIKIFAKNTNEDTTNDNYYSKKYLEESRTFILSKEVIEDTFNASIENGLLTITVNKKDPGQNSDRVLKIPIN